MKSTVLIIAVLCGHALWAGRASFSVCVLDADTGSPIKGIKIEGAFLNYSRGWNESAKDNNVDAWTDSNGYAKLSGNTEAGVGGYRILRTPGYYNAEWTEIEFREQSILRLGAWVPSDIVSTARLDRVISPIPLSVALSRPFGTSKEEDSFAEGKTVALYDLLKNDWLPPFGKGQVGDISFSSKRTNLGSEPYNYPSGIQTNEFYRYDVQVRFVGDGNGMKESMLPKQAGIKLRTAPETGYEPTRVCWSGRMSRTEYKNNSSDERCYFFRIRTEFDELGKIKSAIYGKIYGDFKLVGKKNGIKGVSFLYYLNPTPNDRNLEWDMQHNLCPNAKDIGVPEP